MKKYTTLLFDLDNTLFDFDYSEHVSAATVFKENGLPCDDASVNRYSEINLSFWKAFEKGEIKSSEIHEGRFRQYIKEVGGEGDTAKINSRYFELLCGCAHKKPYCDEIIDYLLAKGYEISIVTNGTAQNQHSRIGISGLKDKIKHLFISDEIGYQKPKKEFFDAAFAKLNEKDRSKILIIGDSLSSDIKGGINAGIDTCYITNGKAAVGNEATYVLPDLISIKNIL